MGLTRGHKFMWVGEGRWIWEELGEGEYDQNSLYKILRELI